VTRDEITAQAEKTATEIGLTPGTANWYRQVCIEEARIEIDLQILHDMLAGPIFVPPLPGAPNFEECKPRRRYWKKVKFTDGS
jgi:hypothetical protein